MATWHTGVPDNTVGNQKAAVLREMLLYITLQFGCYTGRARSLQTAGLPTPGPLLQVTKGALDKLVAFLGSIHE